MNVIPVIPKRYRLPAFAARLQQNGISAAPPYTSAIRILPYGKIIIKSSDRSSMNVIL